MASFGNYIKTHREEKGWSQTEFGAKVKINTPAVNKIENDHKKFPVGKLKLLAQLFELDYNQVKRLVFCRQICKRSF
jgi:transcriptional regulator with XRE-family HTH domain